ncbi:MAG: hypothetical protein WC517_05010 [Patescibacteria group bacterium]
MKSFVSFAILAAVLVGLTGCPASLNSILLTNLSDDIVVNVFLSPSSSDDWGVDQLPGYIYPGDSFLLHSIPNGVYDLLIIAADGSYWEKYGISLYGGEQRSFDLLNYKNNGVNVLEEMAGSQVSSQPFNVPAAGDKEGFDPGLKNQQ